MELKEKLGELINSGVSRNELAKILGITPRTLTRWAIGVESPKNPEDANQKLKRGLHNARTHTNLT